MTPVVSPLFRSSSHVVTWVPGIVAWSQVPAELLDLLIPLRIWVSLEWVSRWLVQVWVGKIIRVRHARWDILEAHPAGDFLRLRRLLVQIASRIVLSRRVEICQALGVLGVFDLILGLVILLKKLTVPLWSRCCLLIIALDKLAYICRRLRRFINYFLEELFWLAGIVLVSAQRPPGRGAAQFIATVFGGCRRLGPHHSASCDCVSGDSEMVICETLRCALEAIVYAEFFEHLPMTPRRWFWKWLVRSSLRDVILVMRFDESWFIFYLLPNHDVAVLFRFLSFEKCAFLHDCWAWLTSQSFESGSVIVATRSQICRFTRVSAVESGLLETFFLGQITFATILIHRLMRVCHAEIRFRRLRSLVLWVIQLFTIVCYLGNAILTSSLHWRSEIK